MRKQSKANVTPKRQRTQYSCMATSMSMCLQALGYYHANEDEVNKVMGALPMQGASWEQALACVQHYGCRATLTMPSTVKQLKQWTDKGIPVMIAWNPEGRDWSHASVVFHVDEDLNVYVADPNIPDPDETVRVVPKVEFYSKWYEKWPNYLVRRPACAIEREITPDGKQIMASNQNEKSMSKKLTAKDLLKEVQQLKKQASSGLNKPYPIEYEDEADLATSIDSVLLDILDGFGYLGATNVIVKGDTAFVKVQGEVQLDLVKLVNLVSQETADYLNAFVTSVQEDDSEGVTWRPYVNHGLIRHQAFRITRDWNEKASINVEKNEIEFLPGFEHMDVTAPDSVVFPTDGEYMMTRKAFAGWPEISISVPKGADETELPDLIMKGMKQYVKEVRKFMKTVGSKIESYREW